MSIVYHIDLNPKNIKLGSYIGSIAAPTIATVLSTLDFCQYTVSSTEDLTGSRLRIYNAYQGLKRWLNG
ncbi:hypothetical protein H6G27_01355 [Nostoc linckia FACHB-104]|nr:hypothetical protein [Nostoc linckia FACHB-104]